MKSISKLFLCVGLALFVHASDAADTSPISGETQNALDRLSSQMEALVTEMRLLRQELRELRKERGASATGDAPSRKPPQSVSLQLDADDPSLGNPSARVALVEFTDYQCPYCAQFHAQTLPGIKDRYIETGKVKYVVRDFHLNFHPQAKNAAIADNCSGHQNAYWSMREYLFANSRQLEDGFYDSAATALGLDLEDFTTCRTDTAEAKEVDDDLKYGQSVGVRGTPSFFIGRIEGIRVVDAKRIDGAQSFETLATAIDALL